MRTASRILALGVWVGTGLGAGLSPVPAAGDERPLYTNVEVVAVDAARRTVVVRNPEGVEERIELDDQVAGFDDIKAGDRVILALRRESGGRRASAIIKSKAPSPAAVSSAPSPEAEGTDRSREISRLDFAAQVAKLAAEADRVDRLWSEFRKACGVTVSGRYDRAREWFALWDGRARADLSMGFCRDLFNQIVGAGGPVTTAMAGAEDSARRSLLPDDIREIQGRYSLDWDGWGRTPPERLEP